MWESMQCFQQRKVNGTTSWVYNNIFIHKSEVGKIKLIIGNTKKTYRKPSEQLFPNRRPLSYSHLTKSMIQTAQKFDSKTYLPNRITTEVSPRNDQ